MSWVYKQTERPCSDNEYQALYTVGFYSPEGEWISESDHGNRHAAAERCRWLNGGHIPDRIEVQTIHTIPDVKEIIENTVKKL
jgi:hypothetical protein